MQVEALIKELLATNSMNEETTADLNRWAAEAAAGTLLGRLGARAEPVRDLAYRLFLLAERKKLSAEAGIWNALAVAWPDLMDRARETRFNAAPAQSTLAL